MQGNAASLLRKRREALKLTQYEVARSAGVRESDISRWERGIVKSPPLTGMRRVCRVLGIDLEELADALLDDEAATNGAGAELDLAGGRSAASDEVGAEGDDRTAGPRPKPERRGSTRPPES